MGPEAELQCKVAQYLRLAYPQALWCCSLAGVPLSIGAARKAKRMGNNPGFPDLMIFEPRRKFHGMFLELKSTEGHLTDNQARVIPQLIDRDYYCQMARTFDEAKSHIDNYLQA